MEGTYLAARHQSMSIRCMAACALSRQQRATGSLKAEEPPTACTSRKDICRVKQRQGMWGEACYLRGCELWFRGLEPLQYHDGIETAYFINQVQCIISLYKRRWKSFIKMGKGKIWPKSKNNIEWEIIFNECHSDIIIVDGLKLIDIGPTREAVYCKRKVCLST